VVNCAVVVGVIGTLVVAKLQYCEKRLKLKKVNRMNRKLRMTLYFLYVNKKT
jgi:hypothetical protein